MSKQKLKHTTNMLHAHLWVNHTKALLKKKQSKEKLTHYSGGTRVCV